MRKEKCEKCRMIHQGFHICLDNPGKKPQKIRKGHRPSDYARQMSSQRMTERWEQYHLDNAERDAEIVQRYSEGKEGGATIAKDFDISYSTAMKVLRRAEARGHIVIRKPGRTLARGAK